MRQQTLGRTGLSVSVAALGCGGPSRLGTNTGHDMDHAASLVRLAVELGVNLIDTARSYGTEPAVAKALEDLDRDELVISTKAGFTVEPDKYGRGPAEQVDEQLHESLRTLGVETIDIYHMHGIIPEQLGALLGEVLPVLEKAKQKGKVRHLAVSERFIHDPGHMTLPALFEQTTAFDVAMVGFNMLNASARQRVLPITDALDIGVEVMFAVRKALSQPDRLRDTLRQLADVGQVDDALVGDPDPLGFLIDEDCPTLMEAGYRFCAHEPGCHTVLFGTGNPEHLRANIASLNKGPLSADKQERLRAIFGGVDSVSGH